MHWIGLTNLLVYMYLMNYLRLWKKIAYQYCKMTQILYSEVRVTILDDTLQKISVPFNRNSVI